MCQNKFDKINSSRNSQPVISNVTFLGVHKHIYTDVYNFVYFWVLVPLTSEGRKPLRASKAKGVPGE